MNWFYKNREERSKWLAQRFEKKISESESLLDIGCYNADLKTHINKAIKYTGIDIAGKPDLFINLDEIEKLPFNNNQFDTVVCGDVLEHLENFHLIFNEICRVAKTNIIITLPNAHISILNFIRQKPYTKNHKKRNQFGKYSKFYGLPFEKPEDRHRWFFSFDEASDFINFHAERNNYLIKSIENEWKYLKPTFKKVVLSIIRLFNKNMTQKHFICLLEKK